MDATEYPYVSARELSVIERFESVLVNTGGNDPRELINDLGDPKHARMMSTNVVRFVLAVAVQSQVRCLRRLIDADVL